MSTHTFDVAAIVTVDVEAGSEEQARELINGLNQISVATTGDDIEMAGQLEASTRDFSVRYVCPRGRGYSLEGDVPVPEPVLDEDGELEGLWAELASAQEALDGDSNDAEHDALYSLAGAVAGVLGRLGIRNPAREGKGEGE